jgi:hypothetical protein
MTSSGYIYQGKIDLPDSLLKTIKYHEVSQDHIPRELVEREEYLRNVLLPLDHELFGRVCGSYDDIDIDFLIVHSNYIDFLIVHSNYDSIRQLKLL